MKKALKRVRQALALCGVCLLLICTLAMPASAAGLASTGVDDVDALFGNLTSFISGIVKIVGSILCIYGIFQVGMSFSSHDPSQRIQGLMCIAGAVIIFFSPEILATIQG